MLCACNKKALILTCSTYPFLLQNVVVLFIQIFFSWFFFAYSFIIVGNRRTQSHTCSCGGETNVGASECFSRVRYAPPPQTQRMRWIYGNVDFSSVVDFSSRFCLAVRVRRYRELGIALWIVCICVSLCERWVYKRTMRRRRRRKKPMQKVDVVLWVIFKAKQVGEHFRHVSTWTTNNVYHATGVSAARWWWWRRWRRWRRRRLLFQQKES